VASGMNGGEGTCRKAPLVMPFRRRAIAVLFLPLAGCTYFEQRLTDFGDCVLWRWHQEALGVAVEAKVGPLDVGVGGWYADWGQGKDTWWQTPGFVLTNHGTGLPLTTISPIAYGASWSQLFATRSSGNQPTSPTAFADVNSWLLVSDVFDLDDGMPFELSGAQRVSDLFGVEVGVVPVFVGLRVGFNVAEFADALLGFVGIDIFADDGRPRPPTLPFQPGR
jgi:hypothetical protein